MKVADLIARSLRLLRVLDPDEAVEARDYETGVMALNAMMQRWEANRLPLGWQPVVNPAETLPLPPEAEEAVAYNLAVRLAPEYWVTADQLVLDIAREGKRDLRRDVAIAYPLGWERRCTSYDTYTDSYI